MASLIVMNGERFGKLRAINKDMQKALWKERRVVTPQASSQARKSGMVKGC